MIKTGGFYDWWLDVTGSKGVMVYPNVWVSSKKNSTERHFNIITNHEMIHLAQAKEMGWLKFYFCILLEYVKFGTSDGPLETECYTNQYDLNYLKTRKPYAWRKN